MLKHNKKPFPLSVIAIFTNSATVRRFFRHIFAAFFLLINLQVGEQVHVDLRNIVRGMFFIL